MRPPPRKRPPPRLHHPLPLRINIHVPLNPRINGRDGRPPALGRVRQVLEQRVVALLPAVEALAAEEADDLVWVGGVGGVVPACGCELGFISSVSYSTEDPTIQSWRGRAGSFARGTHSWGKGTGYPRPRETANRRGL